MENKFYLPHFYRHFLSPSTFSFRFAYLSAAINTERPKANHENATGTFVTDAICTFNYFPLTYGFGGDVTTTHACDYTFRNGRLSLVAENNKERIDALFSSMPRCTRDCRAANGRGGARARQAIIITLNSINVAILARSRENVSLDVTRPVLTSAVIDKLLTGRRNEPAHLWSSIINYSM